MFKYNFKINQDIFLIVVFGILASIYSMICHVLFRISVLYSVNFVLLQILFTFIPGLLLTKLLSLQKGICVYDICISFAFGYSLNILEYFIYMFFDVMKIARLITITLAIISYIIIIYLNIRGKDNTNIDNSRGNVDGKNFLKLDKYFSLIFICYLIISIICYSGNLMSPMVTANGITELNRDMQFWGINSAALKIKFPADMLFMSGQRLYYHFFSSIHVAISSVVSGIDIFSLSYPLYPFGKTIVFLGGIWCFLSNFKLKRFSYYIIVILLFTTGLERISKVGYNAHQLMQPFGFDIGLGYGFLFLSTFFEQVKKKDIDIKLFIASIIFWITCTGTKGPIAVILIIPSGIMCIYWLCSKQYAKAFLYGCSILLSFLFINIFFIGTFNIVLNLGDNIRNMGMYTVEEMINGKILKLGVPNWIALILTFAIRIVAINPVLLCLLCFFAYHYYKGDYWNRDTVDIKIFVISNIFAVIVGFLFVLLYKAGGRSEMYFGMAAYICIVFLIAFFSIPVFQNKELREYHAAFKVILGLGICFFLFSSYADMGGITKLKSGIHKITGTWSYGRGGFTRYEAEACIWIRDNTELNSVIISDRGVVTEEQGFHYYELFSERQFYLGGWDLIKENYGKQTLSEMNNRQKNIQGVFDNDVDSILKIKDSGVDYIIQSDCISKGFVPDSNIFELVYFNDMINVYHIK